MHQKYDNCSHCGRCASRCLFLKSHGMDLHGFSKHPELAYHCFLCGDCARVCPVKIDGREISMELRRDAVKNGFQPGKNGYSFLLLEKKNYLFRNYRHGGTKSVLFPGCNFPAYFPKTTAYLSRLLAEKAGAGVIYDCCGKPVAELGLENEQAAILAGMDDRLARLGIEELVVLCPNCYYFLKGRIRIKVRHIYEKLRDWGIGTKAVDISDGQLFIPCPDRDTEDLLSCLKADYLSGGINRLREPQCCGLGGSANVNEPALAQDMQGTFSAANGKIYTYCATCAGKIAAGGVEAEHLLCGILGFSERPACGVSTLLNRAACRLK